MPTIQIESLESFTAQHGEYFDIPHDDLRMGTWVERKFSDGASCGYAGQQDYHGHTRLLHTQDPPTGSIERTKAERAWLLATLEREQEAYDRAVKDANEAANFAVRYGTPRVPQYVWSDLDAGKKRIADLQRRIAACDQVLADTPEARAAIENRERERLEAQARYEDVRRSMSYTTFAQQTEAAAVQALDGVMNRVL
jgi:hypothetical protein